MKRIGARLWKWLSPGLPWVLLLAVVSGVLLFLVFTNGLEDTPAAYVSYALSAYALAAAVAEAVSAGRAIRRKLYETPLTNRYLTDAFLRVRVSLRLSFGINLLYAAFRLVCAVCDASFWDGALALYDLLLCGVRMYLIRQVPPSRDPSQDKRELRAYRTTGIFLMVLDAALGGVAVQIVRHGQSYHYAGTLIFAAGFYAFYSLILSSVNTVKYRKFHSPVLSAAKAVNLTTALVSIFSLETAMLDQFNEDMRFRQIMTAVTALAVCVLVLAIAVFMVIRSGRKMRRLQRCDETGGAEHGAHFSGR